MLKKKNMIRYNAINTEQQYSSTKWDLKVKEEVVTTTEMVEDKVTDSTVHRKSTQTIPW